MNTDDDIRLRALAMERPEDRRQREQQERDTTAAVAKAAEPRGVRSTVKTKRYPHVTGVYGDSGENPGALAIHAVLDPSPNYPEVGRIIVGSPGTTPTIPGYIPSLGGFNGGPAAIERLAATLLEAARDARTAIGMMPDGRQFSPMVELAMWRRWATSILGGDGFQGDEEQRAKLETVAKAATAFVDEQGKRAGVELLERADFATAHWEDLVRAVEGAGR